MAAVGMTKPGPELGRWVEALTRHGHECFVPVCLQTLVDVCAYVQVGAGPPRQHEAGGCGLADRIQGRGVRCVKCQCEPARGRPAGAHGVVDGAASCLRRGVAGARERGQTSHQATMTIVDGGRRTRSCSTNSSCSGHAGHEKEQCTIVCCARQPPAAAFVRAHTALHMRHLVFVLLVLCAAVHGSAGTGAALKLHHLASELGSPPLGQTFNTSGELPPELLTQVCDSRHMDRCNIFFCYIVLR